MGLLNQREAAIGCYDVRVLEHIHIDFRKITSLREGSIAFSFFLLERKREFLA